MQKYCEDKTLSIIVQTEIVFCSLQFLSFPESADNYELCNMQMDVFVCLCFYSFFNSLHTFSKLCLFCSKLYTQIQELHTQNAKCLTYLAKWITAFKISQTHLKNICKHLCHNINSYYIFVYYIEKCVFCFSKSVLWNWKLSQRQIISGWFCRFGVRFQILCDK